VAFAFAEIATLGDSVAFSPDCRIRLEDECLDQHRPCHWFGGISPAVESRDGERLLARAKRKPWPRGPARRQPGSTYAPGRRRLLDRGPRA